MNIENMNHLPACIDVRPKTAPPLATTPAQIVICGEGRGKSAQGHVAVSPSVQLPVLSKGPVIAFQFTCEASCLIVFRLAIADVENFLQRRHVCIQLLNYSRNSFWPGASIESAALMDVVSRNSQPLHVGHCWRSKTQPNSSGARSKILR